MVSAHFKSIKFNLKQCIHLIFFLGTNESHGVVKSLATTGSSFGKKADLIDVRSLQLLNPENMALPMEESKDPVIQIQCPDGYEKPITISAF